MIKIFCSLILFLQIIGNVYADNLSLVEQNLVLFPLQNQNSENNDEIKDQPILNLEIKENKDSNLNTTTAKELFQESSLEQKKLAEEHEKEMVNYSILNHKFYENDRIRIFNYTAYNFQELKNTLLNPTVLNTNGNEFFISFGYGMEFKINKLNIIGYEYISSFPDDRGQLLRLYWVRTLSY